SAVSRSDCSVSCCISLTLSSHRSPFLFLFFNHPATTEIYTLSLHDALPISVRPTGRCPFPGPSQPFAGPRPLPPGSDPAAREQRSEEHTSELQSLTNLVCRLLLEKKNKTTHHPRDRQPPRAQPHETTLQL